MPSFNKLIAAPFSTPSTTAQTIQLSGLVVPTSLRDWLLYTFITYKVPALVRIFENVGVLRWYQSTDDEKERLAARYGGTVFYRLCQTVESNIRLFKDLVSVFSGSVTAINFFVEYYAVNVEDGSLLSKGVSLNKTLGSLTSNVNLIIFFLYDVILISVKRYFINKARRSLPLRHKSKDSVPERYKFQGDSVLESKDSIKPKMISGSLDSHAISIITCQQYKDTVIAYYSQPDYSSGSKLTPPAMAM